MPLFPSHSSLFVFTLCLFLCLPVSIGLAECHSDLDKAPVSVLLPHFPLSALVHCVLFFVLWVRVTSHFNQPNWYSSFAMDEAITWLVCCAPWSLNGEGRLPWEKRSCGLAFSSVFVQLVADASTTAAGQEHQQAVEQEALLGWLFREAVEQKGFTWFNAFFWFNYYLPLVLTYLRSEITWGAEQTDRDKYFIIGQPVGLTNTCWLVGFSYWLPFKCWKVMLLLSPVYFQ